MKRVILLFSLLGTLCTVAQTVSDDFSDGNYVAGAAIWSGPPGVWSVSPDATTSVWGPDELGANVLHLNAGGGAALPRHLSTPNSTWGAFQSWTVWFGRTTAATSTSRSIFWLFANAADVTTATVDGYRIVLGDNLAGGDRVVLERVVNGLVVATIVTSSTAVNNARTDFAFKVRVTHNGSNQWQIFTGVDLSTIPEDGGESPTSNPFGITGNASPLTTELGTPIPITGSGFMAVHVIQGGSSLAERRAAAFDLVNFGADNLLPVTFTDFRVIKDNEKARLSWKVAVEDNVDGYEVERSANGVQFSKLGYIKANGGPNYNFTDEKILPGANFYRVKNIDIDGKFAYTHIVSINGKKGQFIRIFPIPARTDLYIQHHEAISGAELKVTSMEGRIVRVIKVPPNATQTILDLSALQSGVYFASYDAGDGNKLVSRFVKQ